MVEYLKICILPSHHVVGVSSLQSCSFIPLLYLEGFMDFTPLLGVFDGGQCRGNFTLSRAVPVLGVFDGDSVEGALLCI